jgi:hypothetical protein
VKSFCIGILCWACGLPSEGWLWHLVFQHAVRTKTKIISANEGKDQPYWWLNDVKSQLSILNYGKHAEKQRYLSLDFNANAVKKTAPTRPLCALFAVMPLQTGNPTLSTSLAGTRVEPQKFVAFIIRNIDELHLLNAYYSMHAWLYIYNMHFCVNCVLAGLLGSFPYSM